jgi:TRAP transporter TAXI family solute receptor
MRKIMTRPLNALAGLLLSGLVVTSAQAEDSLPRQISVTAYGTASSGYAQLLAIGNVLKDKYGTDIRIIPGKNDISRMIPLKKQIADYCACSVAAYFAQEGAAIFAVPDWGPQRLFNIFNNGRGDNGLSFLIAKDTGIKTWADIKGKRVGTVVASPAIEYNTTGMLAFAGLSWSDVERVEFPGFKQMVSGIVSGQVDVVFGNTTGGYTEQLAASPRGITWLSYPHDDDAAWKRFTDVAPYFNKRMISEGTALDQNVTGKVPYEGAGFPYPIYVAYGTKTDDEVYALTKAILGNYDSYKNAAPAASGYQLDRQVLTWVLPYHPGSIRYFTEMGIWSDEAEAHNNMLLKRQDVLAEAWQAFNAGSVSEDKFKVEWMKVRAEFLSKAGMPVVFTK